MGIFRQFPYTNFHEMNMDELIKLVRELADDWVAYQVKWEDLYNDTKEAVETAQQLVEDLTSYVQDYFNDLDVYPFVAQKVDSLVADGTMYQIVLEKCSPVVTQWLADHVTVPSGVVIDTSLSITGACADAKAAGDGIKNNLYQLIDHNYYDIIKDRTESDRTYQGIQYQWQTNHDLEVTGTASDLSFCNLIYSPASLPEYWLRLKGQTVTAYHSGPKSRLNLIFYENEVNIGTQVIIGYKQFTIPANCDGIVVRITVSQGTSCNETCHFWVCSDQPYHAIVDLLNPIVYLDSLSTVHDIHDLNDVPLNSVGVDTGSSANAPDAGAAYVFTFGRYTAAQLWIKFSTGDMWYRGKTGGDQGVWNNWMLVNASSTAGGYNPFAHILTMGNSILNGAVYQNGAFHHLSQYGNAPYSVIANSMNVERVNVTNELHSSTGIVYDAGEGNFIENIMQHDLSNIDVVVTHMWTGDMNTPLGNQSSAAGMNTLIGAIKYLYNWIKSQNLNTQLVLIGVPPCSYTISGSNVFTGVYSNGSSIHDVDVAMHTLANNLHFTYVDWEDLNLSYSYQQLTDGNNVHANNEDTYRVMGAYIAGRITAEVSF